MRALLTATVVVFTWFALPASAGAQVVLTPAQFTALDAVYTSEAGGGSSSKRWAKVRAACRALDSADPLFGALRRACTADLKLGMAIDRFADCSGPRDRCRQRARRVRLAASVVVLRWRDANAAIEAATLVPACAAALRASKLDLGVLEQIADVYRLVERVLRRPSRTRLRQLRRANETLGRLIDRQPSDARLHKAFRAGCAPAAAPPA